MANECSSAESLGIGDGVDANLLRREPAQADGTP